MNIINPEDNAGIVVDCLYNKKEGSYYITIKMSCWEEIPRPQTIVKLQEITVKK